MKINFRIQFFVTLIFISCAGCKMLSGPKKTNQNSLNAENTARYRTPLNDEKISAELETLLRSVKQIKNYSSYRTNIFDDNSRITLNDLNSEGLLERTRAGLVTNDATAGTALVIYSDGNRIALLTCAHALKAPDTIIEWADYNDLSNNRYIHSISCKTRQQLFVEGFPTSCKFEMLAIDTDIDIAIIGTISAEPITNITTWGYPCGISADLKRGNFLYLAGYPKGQQMVTHGIVSTLPVKAANFLTDAPFNDGLSGGATMAVNCSTGDLELVGIARSVTATYGYILKPEKENHEFTYNPAIPYTGSIYVDQKKDINYGITSIISIDRIKQFYALNRTSILSKGFNFDDFFNVNPKPD